MTTTTMIQAVTTMVPTRQMRMLKTMRGKRTTTNLHEIWTPALKTWMSRLNHYPVRWKVWRRTRKRKRPNDSTLPRSTSPPSEVHKAGGSNIGEVSSCLRVELEAPDLSRWLRPVGRTVTIAYQCNTKEGLREHQIWQPEKPCGELLKLDKSRSTNCA